MAKIHEEVIVITISKLVKEDQDVTAGTFANPEILSSLEAVTQELLGDSVVVEVNRA